MNQTESFLKACKSTDCADTLIANLKIKREGVLNDFDERIARYVNRVAAADIARTRALSSASADIGMFAGEISRDAADHIRENFSTLQKQLNDIDLRIKELNISIEGIDYLEGESEVNIRKTRLPDIIKRLKTPILYDGMNFVFVLGTSKKAIRFTWSSKSHVWEGSEVNYDDFSAYYIYRRDQSKGSEK